MGPQPSTSFSHGQRPEGCPHASAWHLVNEGLTTVLREKPPLPQTPVWCTFHLRELDTSQNSKHILAGAGCGPGTPGPAGQGGVSWSAADGPHTQAGPGHPVLGRGPKRLCLQNLSALFPLPHQALPLESWGLGEGQAGPERG